MTNIVWAGNEIWLVPDLKWGSGWEYIPEMRIRDSGLYYLQNYLGINQQFDKSWEGNLYYALKFQQNGSIWPSSHLGIVDLIYKNSWMKNRFRLEQDFTKNLLKYRDAMQFKWANWSIGDEMFFNTNSGYVDEGRSTITYAYKFNKTAEGTAGFLLRRQKSSINADWTWTQVANLGIKLNI